MQETNTMAVAQVLRGCKIAPEKSFAGVLATKAFFKLRSRLQALKLYDWLCFDGGWNEEDTREFYSSLSLGTGDEEVITWTCHGASFSFGVQDISLAIGVPRTRRTLEEILAETSSVELSLRLLGYDAIEKLDLKRDPMHAAIFARAAQTNLTPVLNPKTAMRRHSLLLMEAAESTCTEVTFDIPKVVFREMIKVINCLRGGKRPPVIGYPFTIRRLLLAKGMVVREPDHYIQCYGFDAIYPADLAAALKRKMYSSQCKMKQEKDHKMEEVLGEVRSLKDFISDIHCKIGVSNVKTENHHASVSVHVDVQPNPSSPIHAKTGPYASCPEDIVADIVQSKLLADCIFVKRWPEVALTSRDLFSLAGAGWKSWISDTIVDTYIDYMRLSMDISQNVTICNSQFLTMLQMYFSYPPSGNGETVEKPVYIDLE